MNLVSIIIPCYNYGWLLPETLDSVLAQTYPHWECLIIDDGSTDDTRAVAERYCQQDARIRYVYQANAGLSAARNTGMASAQGEYVQFLDADDLLASRKLELQVVFLDAHAAVDVVYGGMRYFLHGNPAKLSRSMDMQDTPWMSEADGVGESLINAVVEKSFMVVNAPLVRMALLRRIGNFNEALRSVEDWDYWVRCIMAGTRFHYEPRPETWALVRVHTTSMSQNVAKMHQYEMMIRQRIAPELERMGASEAVAINAVAMERSRANLAAHRLTTGKTLAGIKDFLALASATGNYRYYLGSIGYWLKVRLQTKTT